MNLVDPTGHSWWSKFWKGVGKFFENLVTHPFQTILNIVGIVVGVITQNYYLAGASALNLFNEGTSTFKGGGWNTFHQISGYASIALSVAGGVQAIGNAFNAAARASLMNSMGLSDAPFYQPMANMTGDELTSIFNNEVSTVGQQVAAANSLENLADSAGSITIGPESLAPNGQLLAEPSASTGISVGQIDGIPSGDIQVGQKVFRIYGGDSGAFGQSWTPINPNTLGNARNLLGLPNGNSGQFLLEGRILDVEGISARTALPLDGNTGGAVEYLIPNAAKKVALDKVSNGDF